MNKIACNLCGSKRHVLIAEITHKPEGETDFGIPLAEYRRLVYQCQTCSVYLNVHDSITPGFYDKRYNEATYDGDIHDKYNEIRTLPFHKSDNKQRVPRIVDFINRMGFTNTEMNVLDIGSGLCVFCGELRDLGFRCWCIDPDVTAVEHAVRNVKVDGAHVGTIDSFPFNQMFDFITFNKVLEHVCNPTQLLERARDYLSNQGIVYIELPNGNSALEYGNVLEREEFFIEHLTIFNEESLKFMASKAGFDYLLVESIHEPSDKFTIYGFLVPRDSGIRHQTQLAK